jgi:hypothetical protein
VFWPGVLLRRFAKGEGPPEVWRDRGAEEMLALEAGRGGVLKFGESSPRNTDERFGAAGHVIVSFKSGSGVQRESS